jgi:hypothetical protein
MELLARRLMRGGESQTTPYRQLLIANSSLQSG